MNPFAGILQLMSGIVPILGMVASLEYQERLGDPIIDTLEAKLKASTKSKGQKAIDQAYLDRFAALNSTLNGMVGITQPSSEEQAKITAIEAELVTLKPKLQMI